MHESIETQPIRLSPQVRYRMVGDEGVLVHLENGRVVVVNGLGLHIIQRLKEPMTRNELAMSIAAEFEVTPVQAEEDLDLFLSQLDQDQILDRVGCQSENSANV